VLTRDNGPDGVNGVQTGATQLTLGGALAPRLHTPAGLLGYRPPKWKAVELAKTRRPAAPPISQHLIDPNQPELFELRRDWSLITAGTVVLPSLTPPAQQVIDDVAQLAADHHWSEETLRPITRTLQILLGWLGAEAPIREEDVLSLRSKTIGTTGGRVLSLLAERGLLIPAADRTTSVHQRWTEARIATLPEGIAAELRIWIQVMRGKGRRRRRIRSWTVIRNYLYATLPTPTSWSTDHTSLREITNDHARAALRGITGTTAHTIRTGLRSIFIALKQERIIFRDPTRGITITPVDNLPTPLREEQLRGLINRITSPLERLIVALVAIHALNVTELRALTLTGADTAHGTLAVRRRDRSHTIYLDELSFQLLLDWLRERQKRWPTSINPHLLITAHGAFALDNPPIAAATITRIFHAVGVQAQHLRSDRILHEAATTADPINLMRVFGISAGTAMRYLHAAHPERAAAPLAR
jgi:hypothetical protein